VFTGLITDLGLLSEFAEQADGAILSVETALAGEIALGDSVALNGVCLTACAVDDQGFQAQAIEETLRRSALGSLRAGARLNLELALRAQDRLGGHIVQGHVDGTVTLSDIAERGLGRVLSFSTPSGLERYLVHKGSVAVNGVSLTVSSLQDHGFSVSLIPETLGRTNLGDLRPGECANLEVDILAKHVERLMQPTHESV
jgi:riboflavin synthase